MNGRQFRSILWLRWRLTMNRAQRGGTLNLVVAAMLLVLAVFGSTALFLTALIAGTLLLPHASPEVVMFLWDGVVAAYLLCWLIELMVELQRSELLSLDKLLHLPARLFDVFLFNYLGSWVSFTHLVFLPGMVGLALATVLAKGPSQAVIFPALAGFLLLTTALAYQFRGWLATLMSNPRRRRTVVGMVTLFIVLLLQVPNLISLAARPWTPRPGDAAPAAQEQETFAAVTRIARSVNACLPIGWLPWAADAAARGNPWPGLLGAAGTGLLAAVGLRRAYRTTIRHVTQAGAAAAAMPASRPAAASQQKRAGRRLVERRLPWASEQTAAVAWAELQAYLRAAEVRLLLLTTPLLLLMAGATLLFSGATRPPEAARPLIALGVVAMAFLPMMQLFCNQFAFDRSGFRALVLSCVPRRRILLGKNLALAPLSLVPALAGVTIVELLSPLPISHLAATALQVPIVFLAFCLVGNLASVLAPFPVASGTLKPAAGMSTRVLLNVLFGLMMPLTLMPSLVLLGLEVLIEQLPGWPRLPLYFVGASIELCLLLGLYRLALGTTGALLQRREQRILDIVTVGVE